MISASSQELADSLAPTTEFDVLDSNITDPNASVEIYFAGEGQTRILLWKFDGQWKMNGLGLMQAQFTNSDVWPLTCSEAGLQEN